METPDDAAHARIGVMTGSMGEMLARQRWPQAQIKTFDDIMDAVVALKSGQLDTAIAGFPLALQLEKTNADLRQLPERLDDEETAVAVRLDDAKLLDDVNRVIAELKTDGTLDDMQKRWFKTDLEPYDEPEIDLPDAGDVLTIGVAATREPFNFVDKNGRVTGHDGELARRIGAKLNRPIRFSDMKFMALIPALQSGKVDMIATGMTASDERREQVAFSEAYFHNAQVLIVRRTPPNSPPTPTGSTAKKLASVDDLKRSKVGVLQGSAHESWVQKNLPDATMLTYKAVADVNLALKQKKVDAALYDAETLAALMREDSAIGRIKEPLFSFNVGAGFHKESGELRSQFDQFLEQIRKNGVYDDMVQRWITDAKTEMPKIENRRDKGILTAGVSDVGLPFIAVQDNQLAGFDIELLERFAAHLGRELRFANMDFGSLIAAVATHKVDLIISSIYITPERQEKIDFSSPYFRMDTLVAGLKINLADYADLAESPAARPSFLERVAASFEANLLRERRYLLILDGLKTTVIISLLSTLFGSLLGAVTCFMRMSPLLILNVPARIYIAVLRGTPVLVVLMLVFYVVFASVDINPVLAAVLAFGMNFAAYIAEVFRTGIEGVDRGQTEAGLAMGFSRIATFRYVVLPQMLRRILPIYKGEFISLVKMTSIVGYIAVQDLTKASDIIRSRTFDAFFPLIFVAFLYFVISGLFIRLIDYVEFRIDPKLRRDYRRRRQQSTAASVAAEGEVQP